MENKPRFVTVKLGKNKYVFVNPNYIVSILPFRRKNLVRYYVRYQDEEGRFKIGSIINADEYYWLVGTNEEEVLRDMEIENDSKRNTDDSRE